MPKVKMSYIKYILPIVFVLLFFCTNTVYGQLTTVGKEFWFGFMENNTNGENGTAVIVISANEAAQGTIDLSNFSSGLTYNFNLQAGQNYTLRIPESQQDLLNRNSGRVENKGIHIISDGKVSVHAFNERLRSADGTVVLPVTTLGKEYYVTSHFEITPNNNNQNLNYNNESLFMVVAVEDNTTVEITPSERTIDGKAANTAFQVVLNAGQSYQLKARADLTGSRVRVLGTSANDCKNVAVFGGNKWTGVGKCGNANDHLFQQMYPINTWGKEFIHIPLKDRSSGELVKIIAAEDDTEISMNGISVANLDQGGFKNFELGAQDIRFIESDKPISVTTFSKSQNCNLSTALYENLGDPFMVTYSPNEQMLTSITFEAMSVQQIQYNYVNIIVASSSVDQTRLDGRDISGEFIPVPSNPSYEYARINIYSGTHKLSNAEGFIAYVYGFGEIESYGYSVGASLENLNFLVEPEYEFEVVGDKVACLNQESLWSIEPENPIFTYFTWDFGDGTGIKEGQEVNHTFENAGEYTVTVTASISENSCEEQEDISFEVIVLETKGEIMGANMVCPDVDEIIYELANTENIGRVNWEVFGGELLESDAESATVLWGEANDMAYISAQPFTESGCPGEPIILEVEIDQRIEPKAPIGPVEICFDPNELYTYEVSQRAPERTYQWFITGGEIVSGADGELVEVKWDNPGIQGELWYEEASLLDAMCAGISESLDVNVNPEIISEYTKEDINCFGGNEGEILLSTSGGTAPYSYQWSHDENLLTNTAYGLEAGMYSVTVIDSKGCEFIHKDIEIKQPDQLQAEVIQVVGTSCYGKEDGELRVQVSGGVPPYRVDYESASFQSNEFYLTNLAGGEQAYFITDANNCQVNISLEVPSPEPILVDIELVKKSCPGESTGVLLAVPSGGNGPFTYTWDYDQSTGARIEGLPKGIYSVSVLDQNGCISLGAAEMPEAAPIVRMPTGFNPTDDGEYSLFQLISNCNLDYALSIYNRWGELIYSGAAPWNGRVNDNLATSGSYTYLIEYTYILEGNSITEQQRGVFTVVY
ncbi:PKD domain-containing protein [Echinicola salinicaeni]|uniref:PKD domain-containing protein n=1 Tax=Echinicola salinicaeni TaxID=2762757 RepID=UPI001E2F0EE2|nr:PKD domain-containing protein [Echinicola salinicaeni]